MLDEYDFSTAKRGSVRPHPGQTRITIWVDTDVYEGYLAYSEHRCQDVAEEFNRALRQHLEALKAPEGTAPAP
jgi:hypothetical protein